MDKNTKHRILGALVVVAAVIILLPLLQSGKSPESQPTLIKAPPFPDQSIQVNSNPPTTRLENTATETDNVNQQPDDTISINHPSIVNNISNSPQPPHLAAPSDIVPITNVSNETKQAPHIQSLTSKAHVVKRSPLHTIHVLPAPNDNNGLVKLKNAVWVIQLGSFKNKTNALRLVNHLRAQGYKAFIQQVSTAFGKSTRVFVGPEYKQASANALASRLENHIHIRGMVIRYQPLTL